METLILYNVKKIQFKNLEDNCLYGNTHINRLITTNCSAILYFNELSAANTFLKIDSFLTNETLTLN